MTVVYGLSADPTLGCESLTTALLEMCKPITNQKWIESVTKLACIHDIWFTRFFIMLYWHEVESALAFFLPLVKGHNLDFISVNIKFPDWKTILQKLQGFIPCSQWGNLVWPAQESYKAKICWIDTSGGTRNFLVGGIEGAKCDSEGAKIQKFVENGWFWPFFFWLGGQSLRQGGHLPPCSPLMPPLIDTLKYRHIKMHEIVMIVFFFFLKISSVQETYIAQ